MVGFGWSAISLCFSELKGTQEAILVSKGASHARRDAKSISSLRPNQITAIHVYRF